MSCATVGEAAAGASLISAARVCATGLMPAGAASANAPTPQCLRKARRAIGADLLIDPVRKISSNGPDQRSEIRDQKRQPAGFPGRARDNYFGWRRASIESRIWLRSIRATGAAAELARDRAGGRDRPCRSLGERSADQLGEAGIAPVVHV